MRKMPMVGRLYITRALRYANHPLVFFYNPTTLRKGYLDIVRWLFERGGAAESVDGVHGVDMRSKGGWTPLSEFGQPRDIISLRVFLSSERRL
jgi:hypothetical protein